MFESRLMEMPVPRDIVIYWPALPPRAFSVVQKPWGWAHILVQKPWGWAHILVQKPPGGGMVTGQIDTCINSSQVTSSVEQMTKLIILFQPCFTVKLASVSYRHDENTATGCSHDHRKCSVFVSYQQAFRFHSIPFSSNFHAGIV